MIELPLGGSYVALRYDSLSSSQHVTWKTRQLVGDMDASGHPSGPSDREPADVEPVGTKTGLAATRHSHMVPIPRHV